MAETKVKDIVAELLKKEKRSASWLSEKMGMTPDGLRLSLVNETIKYSNVVRLCGILGVRASLLFGEEERLTSELVKHDEIGFSAEASRAREGLGTIPRNDERTIIKLLKEQIKDKQLIIDLLIKQVKTSECGDTEINSA
jgi:hypothetical protein